MKDLIAKIDGIINDIKGAEVWSYVKNAVEKIKSLLGYLGEEDAYNFVDILTK